MKKFIFSAIAMIAFVGSSNANNVAEKEIVINDSIEISSQKMASTVVLAENCNLVKFRYYNLAIELGYSKDKASDYSYVAYFQCVSNNLKEVELGLSQ